VLDVADVLRVKALPVVGVGKRNVSFRRAHRLQAALPLRPALARTARALHAAALVLWGGDDRFVPRAHAEAYAAGLPQARLNVIEGRGHALHLEQPAQTADAILDFLRA